MNSRIPVLLFCGFLLCAASAEGQSALSQKPNFIVFLVDDMGWIDPACYGNPFHETPHIDRLAGQGMRFTNAYAAGAVCSPTRASLLTGKSPAALNITDFIPGHPFAWARLKVPQISGELALEEITFAEVLNTAGYATGSFGKWHLGGRAHYPDHQGFDEFCVSSGRHFDPKLQSQPAMEVKPGEYLAEVLTDRAIRFMTDHRDQPFCLYLPHYAVHIPLEARQDVIEKYQRKQPKPEGRVNNPTYAAMVEHIDESVGNLVAALDDLKLSERTVFLFFSDNGGLYQSASRKGERVMTNAPLRDEKGSLYEGGIRVPLIVRWPGQIAPGQVCDEPVSSVDVLPTLAELAGVKLEHAVEGSSLVPLLKQTGQFSREALYWHYPHYHHSTPAGGIRMGDYKLLEFFEDQRLELYNLKNDLGETKNLAETEPERARAMREKLAAWRESVHAKMPTANLDYDPQRANQLKPRRRAER
jgi:uncharacterized sulfatase